MIDWTSSVCAKTVAGTQRQTLEKNVIEICLRKLCSESTTMVVTLCINSLKVVDISSPKNKEEGALPGEANAE